MRKLFGSAGAKPYRLWKILRIEDVFALRLARVSGLAVQERDKRKKEPGAVFLDLVLQRDSIHHGRRVLLRGLRGHRIPS